MKLTTALKTGVETVASIFKSRFLAEGFRLTVPPQGLRPCSWEWGAEWEC